MSGGGGDPGGQLPLALRYPPDQRLDTFFDAPAGCLAQLQSLAGSGADWLYLQGPEGTGKTHLALALCAAADHAGRRTVYLPVQAASGRLGHALDALDGSDVVALDGLDAIAGQACDERALFDFHNRARAARLSVLYTARAAPDRLGLGLPDLQSRLSQCARVTLSPLDDAARRAVLRERALRRGLMLDDAALDWLLLRAGRNLALLAGLLDRLDHASLAAKRRITVPFLRQSLGPTLGTSD